MITVYQESITLLAMVKNLAADFKRFLTSVEYDPPEEWSQTTKAATDENIEKVNNMSLNGRYLKVYESQGFLQAVCRICEMLSQNKRENESTNRTAPFEAKSIASAFWLVYFGIPTEFL